MNWIVNSLNWWQWTALLAIPPAIVLLYFLKLKRQPLEVPSTYLWHRTIEDLHVNSIWQRLRQNLLLFLQLLLLLLAILSCLRPSWEGSKLSGHRYVFLVDTSASMSATDVAPTRLEHAKKTLAELIDTDMKPGTVAMIISFSDRAVVEQPFTDNRRLLKAKIKSISQTQHSSLLGEALRVAAGLANPGRTGNMEDDDVAAADAMPATLMVFSDGRFRKKPNFAMGNLTPIYVPIGKPDSKNVGISAFSTATSPDRPGFAQIFGQIENYSSFDTQVTANLYLNDKLVDAANVSVSNDESGDIEFTLNSIEEGKLKLEIPESDDFLADNTAYAVLDAPQKAEVLLVTDGNNESLELVLSTQFAARLANVSVTPPDTLKTEDYKKKADSGAYNLVIYDRCVPPSLPQANTYFIGAIPKSKNWTAGELLPEPFVLDANLAHPVLQLCQFGNVNIATCTPLEVPKGGKILMDSQHGPLLAISPRDGFEDLVQGFELTGKSNEGKTVNTNWIVRPSFPVFVGNVLLYMGGASAERDGTVVEPGQTISLRSSRPVDEVTVESPNNRRVEIRRGAQSTFVFSDTDTKGVYSVYEANEKKASQRFAVNLFDDAESNIVPADVMTTEYEEIAGDRNWEPTRREAWKYLLGAALVVLIVEWYVYNKRVYL